MPLQFWFWILMAGWLFVGLYREYESGQPYPLIRGLGNFLIFVLLGILGWAVFSGPVK